MANVLRSVRRAERTAAALPTGYRVNLALYVLVLLGTGLIAMEVRGTPQETREVQTLPRPATETTRPGAPVDTGAPTVLGPGDLTPTPPAPVTPGGVVIGQPGPGLPAGGTGSDTTESAGPTPTPVAAAPDPTPLPPIFTPVPAGTAVVPIPTGVADRASPLAADPVPTTGTEGSAPGIARVTPITLPPVHVPPPVSVVPVHPRTP